MEVWQGKFDTGFSHYSDAVRLAIIGEDGICSHEEFGLALITNYYLRSYINSVEEKILVTILASSLRFDVLDEKYNAKVLRTPVGERFLSKEITK